MPDKEKDVNTEGVDNVTEDLSDFASSDEDLETHNPDKDEYDKILAELEASDESNEDEASGETETTDDSEGGDAEDGEPGTKDKAEEDARIPKSRLDEVIGQRDDYKGELDAEKEARVAAESRADRLEERIARLEKGDEPKTKTLPLDDLLSGDPQTVVDAFTEDPAKFLSGLEARIEAKNRADYEERRAIEEQDRELKARLDEFSAKHEDFIPSIPNLGKSIGNNPIHNAISAYYEVVKVPSLEAQITDLQGQVETAKTEGIKQGRKEAIEAIRAKGLAATLDGSSSSGERPEPDDELDDTESSGGVRSVLGKKLIDRRKAQGAA